MTSPAFRYRFVSYGTQFVAANDPRTAPPPPRDDEGNQDAADMARLHPNEVVTDVGERCLGANTDLMVFDHHFAGAPAPCASAAVLLKADAVIAHSAGLHNAHPNDPIWLVSHQQPDFDALCSLYLARKLMDGTLTLDGWRRTKTDRVDWFGRTHWLPPSPTDDDRRWGAAVLLAKYATHIDHCRRLYAPRHRALRSVLYASLSRGRQYADEGCTAFFDAAMTAMVTHGRNPLTDALFTTGGGFDPELELLDRQAELYSRDLTRARKTTVYLPVIRDAKAGEQPFERVEPPTPPPAAGGSPPPLLTDGVRVDPAHLRLVIDPDAKREPADGVFLRDPECLFFKDWVRDDLEHSPSGRGFLFTAIANSNAKPAAATNRSEYFFSLDPERADGRHLYAAFARLQECEVFARSGKPNDDSASPRRTYTWRGRNFKRQFIDPWFDGGNYKWTIVVTPNGGTAIEGEGTAADLSDDHVAALVSRQLELNHTFTLDADGFPPNVAVFDLPLAGGGGPLAPRPVLLDDPGRRLTPVPADHYRFARVALRPDTDVHQTGVAEQVARHLWRHLDPITACPPGRGEHMVVGDRMVAVWTSRGVAVAYTPDPPESKAKHLIDEVQEQFTALVRLAGEVHGLVGQMKAAGEEWRKVHHAGAGASAKRVEAARYEKERVRTEAYTLLGQMAGLKHFLASPTGEPLARFFRASGLDAVLELITETESALSQDESLSTIAKVQEKVELVELFIIAVYAVELIHAIAHGFHFDPLVAGGGVILFGAMAFAFGVVKLKPKQGWKVWLYGGLTLLMVLIYAAVGLGLGGKFSPPAPPTAATETPPH